MKKLSCLLLIVVLAVTLAVGAFAAEPSLTVSGVNSSYAIGEEFKVTVAVVNNPGFGAVELQISYDKDVLELTALKGYDRYGDADVAALLMEGESNIATGSINHASSRNTPARDGNLCIAYFKVIGPGEATVTVASNRFSAWVSDESGSETTDYTIANVSTSTMTVACDKENNIHGPATKIPAVPAGCTTKGATEGSKCSLCGEVFTAPTDVEPTGHNVTTWSPADGTSHSGTCTVCTETVTEAHVAQVVDALEPTCTQPGHSAGSKCSVCNAVLTATTPSAATGHNVTTWTADEGKNTHTGICQNANCPNENKKVTEEHQYGEAVVVNATCVAAGSSTKTCKTCGHDDVTVLPQDTSAHGTIQDVAAVPVTCLTDGYTAGKQCELCQVYTEGHQLVTAAGAHQVTTWVSDGNGQNATHHGTCSRVNDGVTCGTLVSAQAHVWDESRITTHPTCTDKGVRTYTCVAEGCGATYTTDVPVDPNAHGTPEAIPETPADCVNEGTKGGTRCSLCKTHRFTEPDETTPATGHNVTTWTADEGKNTHTGICQNEKCPNEGKSVTEEHDYKDPVVVAATCVATGTSTEECKVCGHDHVTTLPIDSKAHNEVPTAKVEPTCTTPGSENGTHCDRVGCGAVLTQPTVIDALGHKVTTWTSDGNGKNATHTGTCQNTNCPNKDSQVTVPHSWDEGEITQQPDCTNTGIKTYTCVADGCGATYTEDVAVVPDAHKEASTDAIAPTCTAAGTDDKGTHCSVCDIVLTEPGVVPATGHKIDNNGWKDDPADDEYHHGKCGNLNNGTTCGEEIQEKHGWDEGKETEAPKCDKVGTKTYTCSVCNGTKTEDIPKIPHKLTGEDVEITDTHHHGVCEGCGNEINEEHIWVETKGRATKSYSCVVCGATKTVEVPDDNTGTKPGSDIPGTGDDSPIALLVTLLVLCAGGITALVIVRKKAHNK